MPSLGYKKLVFGFLALAVLASTLAFGLQKPAPVPEGKKKNAPVAVKTSGNAFVEQLTEKEREDLGFNYTDTATRYLAEQLVLANPQGPRSGLDLPDLESVSGMLAADIVAKADLDLIAREAMPPNLTPADIRISKKASAKEYAAAVQNIWNGELSEPGFLAVIEGSPTMEGVNAVQVGLDQVIRSAQEIEVPEEFVRLHLSFLTMLRHERKMLEVSRYTEEDPLKAALLFELETQHLWKVAAEFGQALREAEPRLAGAAGSGTFDRVLGVPTAHAQWIVWDPVKFGQAIYEFVRDSILETIKDRFVHRMVQQVITWVQGGGKPQFVTNWKGFLADAANEAVGDVLAEVAPELCRSFGPLIRVSLLPVQGADTRPVTCTLDEVVQNVDQFYNDFKKGGWLAYGAVLEPQNNFYGALINTSDLTAKLAAEAREAKKKKAESSKGFQDQEVCVKQVYEEVPGEGGNLPSRRLVCKEWKTTTPGGTTASITNQSLMGPLHRIVNAEDIAALASALINSALNKLVGLGTRGLLGITSGSGGERFPDPCKDQTGQARERCKQDACKNLPEDLKRECEEAIREGDETAGQCETGEEALDSGNASGVDPSGTPGVWCDADPFDLEEATAVRVFCIGNPGTGFISENRTSCNDRSDEPPRPDIGGGWTFDAAGGVFDINGEPVEFTETIDCTGRRDQRIFELPAGRYQGGAFTNNPSTGIIICKAGIPPISPGPRPTTTTTPVIASVAPNPAWADALIRITGTNINGILTLTKPDGTFEQIPIAGITRNGVPNVEAFFRVPRNFAPQTYTLRVTNQGNTSGPWNLTIRERRPEDAITVEATTGWNGAVAHNPLADTWLVVSQHGDRSKILGRMVQSTGDFEGEMFQINGDPGVGSPRAVFAPNLNKFLVVWGHELTRDYAIIQGRFLNGEGAPEGSVFTVSDLNGVPYLTDSTDLRYDARNSKFVLAWEQRVGRDSIIPYLKTIDGGGAMSQAVRIIPGNDFRYFTPDVVVNENLNEYCIVYSKEVSNNASHIGIRRVDPVGLTVGPEVIVTQQAFGYPQLAYNSRDAEYLVAWQSSSNADMVGRRLESCQSLAGASSAVSLQTEFGGSNLAYNPVSNAYGLLGIRGDAGDIYNSFVALKADLSELIEYDVFFDGRNGNYVPTIGPNLADGTFGGASSKDYETYRFAPNLGASVLKTR